MPTTAAAEPERAVGPVGSPLVGTARRLARNRKGIVGIGFLVVLVVVAIFGRFVVPYDPNEVHVADQLAPPSATYWLGTDELGRDVFSRLIAAARPAVQAGLLAVSLAGVVIVLRRRAYG